MACGCCGDAETQRTVYYRGIPRQKSRAGKHFHYEIALAASSQHSAESAQAAIVATVGPATATQAQRFCQFLA